MVLEATLGRKLNNRMDSHYRCANRICVNPEHVQEASKAENTAEMKPRKYFIARIQELENSLRFLEPNHPLLSKVAI